MELESFSEHKDGEVLIWTEQTKFRPRQASRYVSEVLTVTTDGEFIQMTLGPDTITFHATAAGLACDAIATMHARINTKAASEADNG